MSPKDIHIYKQATDIQIHIFILNLHALLFLKIEARETNPPNNVAVVQVRVTLVDENDNSPAFTSNKYDGKVFANQTVGMLLVQVSY